MQNPITESARKMQQAEQLRQAGRLADARHICERLLREFPDYYAALHTLGLVHADQGNHAAALSCLAQAQAYYPDSPTTLIALGTVYFELGARDLAIQTLERAATLGEDNPALHFTLAETLRDDREYEAAIQAYRKTLSLEPGWREARFGLAYSHESIGEYQQAVDILSGLAHDGDDSLTLACALASLPRLPEGIDLEAMLETFARQEASMPPQARIAYLFARFRFLHTAGQHAAAWEALEKANNMKASTLKGERKKTREWEDQSLRLTREHIPHPATDRDATPITSLFILGASRSGKTTIEALAGLLPGVKRGFENPIVINAVRRAFREAGLISSTQYALLPEPLEANCRRNYLAEMERRAMGHQVFTNTSPSRIHDAFRMIDIFPDMKFLFVKRNRADTAARIYATNYRSGNFHAYHLDDIRRHLDWYEAMIDTLCDKYPESTAVVQYEEFVRDPSRMRDPLRKLTGLELNVETPTPGNDLDFSAPYRDRFLKFLS